MMWLHYADQLQVLKLMTTVGAASQFSARHLAGSFTAEWQLWQGCIAHERCCTWLLRAGS
jgi:hypothetical protein